MNHFTENKWVNGFCYLILLALILWVMMLNNGCATEKRCARKWGKLVIRDTVTITKRDTVIFRKETSVRDTIYRLDSLIKERVYIKRDSLERTELKYWRDAANRLMIKCTSLATKDTVTITKTIHHQHTTQVVTDNKIPWWIWVVGGTLLLIIVILAIKK